MKRAAALEAYNGSKALERREFFCLQAVGQAVQVKEMAGRLAPGPAIGLHGDDASTGLAGG